MSQVESITASQNDVVGKHAIRAAIKGLKAVDNEPETAKYHGE